MKTTSPHRLMLVALLLVSTGLIVSPAVAQQGRPTWKPRLESIVVSAGPTKNWSLALSASRLGTVFMVSASIPVPYSDLDLGQEPGATELGRRIQVAARLVCHELDVKYPPTQYPIVEGYQGADCVRATANDSMSQANVIIASARR
jgi:UrcA family protein